MLSSLKNLEFKRLLAMLLVVCTLIGFFPQLSGVSVYADSSKLRETYIQLMSGASVVGVDAIGSPGVFILNSI